MENGPFIDDVHIKTSIYEGFSMAMLNIQRVIDIITMVSNGLTLVNKGFIMVNNGLIMMDYPLVICYIAIEAIAIETSLIYPLKI